MTTIPLIFQDMERFVDRYSLGFERGKGSQHFLRVKIPNGILTVDQFRGLAHLARKYSKGYAEITDRQDIQLHWINGEDALDLFTALEELGFTTDKCGQAYPGARYGDVRNIVGCPVAGVDRYELIDASPILRKVSNFFTGKKEYLDLPRKFKMSISGCALNCTSPEIQDLAFVAVEVDGRVGFSPMVGGGLGPPPIFAKPLGVFVEPELVLDVARSVVEVYRDYGRRDSKAKARFKWFVEDVGVNRVREFVEEKLGRRLESYEMVPLPVSGYEHVGVNRQKQEGLYYINVPVVAGELSSDLMLKIADIAEKYGWPELRLTPHQNLIILGVQQHLIPTVLDKLREMGLDVRRPALRWHIIACPVSFCGKVHEDVKKRAHEVLRYLEERLGEDLNLPLRIYISGCPNACARHPIADIGLQPVESKGNDEVTVGYNLYLGGSLGPKPSLARLILKKLDPETLKWKLECIVRSYLKMKRGNETFSDFCSRYSDEELRSLMEVVDN